jgi:ribosomal protein S12 methylthiotransferase
LKLDRGNEKKFHLVSLGCARNLVDSELMLGRLMAAGWIVSDDPGEAHTIIVNTCSFIEPAIDESIDTILELAAYKQHGVCKRLVVTGCLAERFQEGIADTLPEVDSFLGTGAFEHIVSAAQQADEGQTCHLPDPNLTPLQTKDAPRVCTTLFSAYLKIAEGCGRHCTYCIIPDLRGRQRSRPPGDILEEAQQLIASGAKEIILIAQESSAYGRDLSPPIDLSRLLNDIALVDKKTWIRLLYGHPASLDKAVIQTVSEYPNLCAYYDMPIQHASDRILKRMNRGYKKIDLTRTIDTIRDIDPEGALRTTVIVGFPGETDDDFEQLVDFIETVRFDHLGTFMYSDAEDLPSHRLDGHVPENVAQDRFDRLMSIQAAISLEHNRKRIGSIVKVLVEKEAQDQLFSGRTAFQAPDVDGLTYIRAPLLQTGRFTDVKVTDAHEYDLIGEPV